MVESTEAQRAIIHALETSEVEALRLIQATPLVSSGLSLLLDAAIDHGCAIVVFELLERGAPCDERVRKRARRSGFAIKHQIRTRQRDLLEEARVRALRSSC